MSDSHSPTATVSDSIAAESHRNNNAFAHERDGQVLKIFRLGHKAKAEQLVEAGIFPTEERARRRMKRLEERKKVRFHGWYETGDKRVKVWGIGHAGPNLSHSVELLDIALKMNVDQFLVGKHIDKETRKKWDLDYIIKVDDTVMGGEHDRATEDLAQIQARMNRLADCPFDILWTCPDEQRIVELMGATPNDKHWFTTFAQATTNPHAEIWVNRAGETAAVPNRSTVQIDVQSDGNG